MEVDLAWLAQSGFIGSASVLLTGMQRWLKLRFKSFMVFRFIQHFLLLRVSYQSPSIDGVEVVYYSIFNVLKDMEDGLGLFLCPNSRRLNADVLQKCKIFCYRAEISFLYQ